MNRDTNGIKICCENCERTTIGASADGSFCERKKPSIECFRASKLALWLRLEELNLEREKSGFTLDEIDFIHKEMIYVANKRTPLYVETALKIAEKCERILKGERVKN